MSLHDWNCIYNCGATDCYKPRRPESSLSMNKEQEPRLGIVRVDKENLPLLDVLNPNGPLLVTSGGSIIWLSNWDRLLLIFKLTNMSKLDKKYKDRPCVNEGQN